jgi:SPP1 gp7 family putative phage head morphogenesis protein
MTPKTKARILNARAKGKAVNPLKYDPSRTFSLRRALCAELSRRFARVKAKVVKLLVDEDALGLSPPDPLFSTNSEDQPRDDRGRWVGTPHAGGLRSYEEERLIPPDQLGSGEPAIAEVIRSGGVPEGWDKNDMKAIAKYRAQYRKSKEDGWDNLPKAQYWNGKLVVGDGSHRVIAALAEGATHVRFAFDKRTEKVKKTTTANAKEFPFNCAPGQLRDATTGRCGPGVGINVPRESMPQVRGEDLEEFLRFARGQGVGVSKQTYRADELSPTQKEFRQERVDSMDEGALREPVIVSRDLYVLDGTHRWVKAWQGKPTAEVPAVLIDLPLQDALDLMRRFPKAKFVENELRFAQNMRWKAVSTPQKVQAFQAWLRERLKEELTDPSAEALMLRYAELGFQKGAARAWDDAKKVARGQQTLDFYAESRGQFLKDSFARPVQQERIELLAARSFDDLENVTEDMATRMSRELTDGLVEGKSPREIARDLSEQADVSRDRTLTIARTEVVRAHADGQLNALERMGVGEVGVQVEWVATDDGRACPQCEAMAGTVSTLEEAKGQIPHHPNCRCAWVPELGGVSLGKKEGKEDRDGASDEEPTENYEAVSPLFPVPSSEELLKFSRSLSVLNVEGGGENCGIGPHRFSPRKHLCGGR